CRLKGPDLRVNGLATLEHASPDKISFLTNSKYRVFLPDTQAAAVILSEEDAVHALGNVLVMKQPHIGFAKVAHLFDHAPQPVQGVHATALIHPSVKIPELISIGPYVVIDEGVILGEGVIIGAGCVVSQFASIGEGSELKPRVVVCHRVHIGARCLIHSGAVIGSDGFGLANENGFWLKIPQLGSVELHDAVEIGANTTIDRGAIENTVIGRGVKIDNQVQIAHNVIVGEGTAMAAQVGIAGSSKIGAHCLLAGKVGINGHITLVDRVIVTAMSGVSNDIAEPGIYSASLPAKPLSEWSKTLARINRLDKLMIKVKEMAIKLRGQDEKS
ncbi:MAG: UDP-3-O-(3-hydroxymyristoyl)glucosamine N-acyltransferase, partial [Gammaproteobacteria bacterium]|nr:UDP-3-O-(3-hydroxymyristoyl)glucosamine N-acyltransferase [Gammaproteobacteria bacterium]